VQRPLARLRHVQGVALRGFAPGCRVGPHDHFVFELHAAHDDGGAVQDEVTGVPLYTSEQVRAPLQLRVRVRVRQRAARNGGGVRAIAWT
jgi:hypothetical protein